MKKFLKSTFGTLGLLIAIPFALPYLATRSTLLFVSFAEILSLLPDFAGSQIRIGYYRLTLRRCSKDVSMICFGSFFTKPDAEIGKGVLISAYCTLGMVTLCDHVAIGSGTHILSGKHQHGFSEIDVPILEQKGRYERVVIGENTWIGNNSVIMASLGKQNVVGAGSIVTRDTGDYLVVAGNPARVIRSLLDAEPVSARETPVRDHPAAGCPVP